MRTNRCGGTGCIPGNDRRRQLADHPLIVVGDLISSRFCRELAANAMRIEHHLRQFDVVPMLDEHLAVRAAANYRSLRERGITADLIIGTF